jgi:hypothetical protein
LARDRARYARLLLEVVAIFGAVFLGFLADDYREYRGDRTRERELLSQLMRDLVADSAQLTEASLPSANRAAALTWLHNNLRRLDVPRDSVIDVLGHVEISTQYSPVTFTYTGLKTSGRLDLIRDDALRDQLVNYFEDRVPYLQILTDGVLREEDEWWNLLAPMSPLSRTPRSRPGPRSATSTFPPLERTGASLGLPPTSATGVNSTSPPAEEPSSSTALCGMPSPPTLLASETLGPSGYFTAVWVALPNARHVTPDSRSRYKQQRRRPAIGSLGASVWTTLYLRAFGAPAPGPAR